MITRKLKSYTRRIGVDQIEDIAKLAFRTGDSRQDSVVFRRIIDLGIRLLKEEFDELEKQNQDEED